MPIDVTMPRLSDTMEAGTVVRWHVKEGDAVSSGAVIADIETDKATMEMQAFDDGTISKILVPEGQAVRVGTKIAEIHGEEDGPAGANESSASTTSSSSEDHAAAASRGAAAAGSDASAPQTAPSRTAATRSPTPPPSKPASNRPPPSTPASAPRPSPAPPREEPRAADSKRRVSPVARRMAEELGVDVSKLRGSGPAGRIIKRDVEAAAETQGARAIGAGEIADGTGGAGADETAGETAGETADRGAERDHGSIDRPARAGASLASPVVPAGAGSGSAAASSLARSGMQSVEVALSGMRQTIAKRLVESTTTIPHYQVSMTFDMDALVAQRGALNRELEPLGVKLSVNDFVVRACALCMGRHPFFNASWGGDRILVHQSVNVGVAVALDEEKGGGLLVATIRDADHKSLRQISLETKTLSEKARTRGLSMEEMSDSTFTISNLGMFGVEHFTAIINPPNSAILACGAALQKPVVRNGELAVGWEMTATLSLDHRVIDGAMAARFLQSLKHLFEHPTLLLV